MIVVSPTHTLWKPPPARPSPDSWQYSPGCKLWPGQEVLCLSGFRQAMPTLLGRRAGAGRGSGNKGFLADEFQELGSSSGTLPHCGSQVRPRFSSLLTACNVKHTRKTGSCTRVGTWF
jgi:hypothetical protein